MRKVWILMLGAIILAGMMVNAAPSYATAGCYAYAGLPYTDKTLHNQVNAQGMIFCDYPEDTLHVWTAIVFRPGTSFEQVIASGSNECYNTMSCRKIVNTCYRCGNWNYETQSGGYVIFFPNFKLTVPTDTSATISHQRYCSADEEIAYGPGTTNAADLSGS